MLFVEGAPHRVPDADVRADVPDCVPVGRRGRVSGGHAAASHGWGAFSMFKIKAKLKENLSRYLSVQNWKEIANEGPSPPAENFEIFIYYPILIEYDMKCLY